MAKIQRSRVGKRLFISIGEVVVNFGSIEDSLHYSVGNHISPGIDTEICAGIFSRVRFSELVEMYQLAIGFVLHDAETYEELSTEQVQQTLKDLKALSKQLSDINERRNTVVHSAYFDLRQMNRDGRRSRTILSASKPNRKALELTEDFNPFGDIHGEIEGLISDLVATHQSFLRFDHGVLPFVNRTWDRFSQRVFEVREKGLLEHPELRLQFPGLRIG